jgi:plasmid stabilization system protein ParE
MSYTLVNRPSVKSDIIEVVNYNKQINPAIAKQFLYRLKEAKTYIQNAPLSFQVKYNQVRTLLLKQFPYHIHYLVDDTKQQIVILAVVHAYKNPKDYI